MGEDIELLAEQYGAMKRRGDLALHFSAAELRRRCARSSVLRRLTFELTWRRRRDAKPAPQIMHTCTVARAL